MTRKKPREEPPTLPERLERSGCKTVAILGLHAGSGAGTVLAATAESFARAEIPTGLTSVAGSANLDHPEDWPGERVRVPAGVAIATRRGALELAAAPYDTVGVDGESDGPGQVVYARPSEDGEFVLHGPEEPAAAQAVVRRLASVAGGRVVVSGRWDNRRFASPGVVDGVVLTLGPDLGKTIEQAATAARRRAEIVGLPPCDEAGRVGWEVASGQGVVAYVGEAGRLLASAPFERGDDPTRILAGLDAAAVRSIVHPGGLTDAFLAPLSKGEFRCRIVVRDYTRLLAAPIYVQGWMRGGGRVQVARPSRLLAVATSPASAVGPDVAPDRFREAVQAEIPDVPVHDVVREAGGRKRRFGLSFFRG